MKINSVLLVDDSEGDQILGRLVLEAYNPEMDLNSAYDGIEALEFLDNCESLPQVIFLDMNMPRMGGIEFLAEFEKRNLPCFVICMLTNEAREDVNEALQHHSDVKQYISKPLEIEDLTKIEAMLCNR